MARVSLTSKILHKCCGAHPVVEVVQVVAKRKFVSVVEKFRIYVETEQSIK
jgi:hypothetical protein